MTALDSTAFTRSGRDLAARDPHLASIVSDHGFPDFWHRPSGFAALALLIVEQQVSLASAKAVFERLVAALGTVEPAAMIAADDKTLTACGLTRQKRRYLRELATTVERGDLDLTGLSSLDDATARSALLAQVGIGPWTADVYLLSSLRRPDIWPIGDRALQVGIGERLEMEAPPSPAALTEIGERWRPFRSVAARLIWHDYLKRRGRSETTVAGLGR